MELKYPGAFIIIAIANPGIDAQKIKKEIFAEINRIKKKGITQEEMDKVRVNIKADMLFALEESMQMVDLFGEFYAKGDIQPLLTYEKRLNALNRKSVQEVAQKYLQYERIVILKDSIQ